jgi:hypothetical protein
MNELLRYKNIIIGAIIIAVFFFVGKNLNANYNTKKEEIRLKENTIEEGRNTIIRWNKLEQEYKILSKPFFRNDTLSLKTLVEEKAQDNQIDISSLTIRSIDKDFYWEAIVKINFSCPYTNYKKFISSLEEKSIEINRIRMSYSKDGLKTEAELRGIVLK